MTHLAAACNARKFLVVEEEGKIGMIQRRWYNCYVLMDGYIVVLLFRGISMKLKGKGEIGELLSRVKIGFVNITSRSSFAYYLGSGNKVGSMIKWI